MTHAYGSIPAQFDISDNRNHTGHVAAAAAPGGNSYSGLYFSMCLLKSQKP